MILDVVNIFIIYFIEIVFFLVNFENIINQKYMSVYIKIKKANLNVRPKNPVFI